VHPDHAEPFTIERETLASVEALTLLNDNHIHDWRFPHLAHEI